MTAYKIQGFKWDGFEYLEEFDDETFENWLSYHFATCERQDLIGATNHSLDILRKVQVR